MVGWRTTSGLRAGMPRPWRVKALRNDGQVVPSSVAAALMLPSRSAKAKARSASVPVSKQLAGLPAHPPLQRRQAPLGEGGLQRVAVNGELAGGLPQPIPVALQSSWRPSRGA
jgi:hypothetical protein